MMKSKGMWGLVICLAAVFAFGWGAGRLCRRADEGSVDRATARELEFLPADPLADIPEDLQVLTIPYLRRREYVSTLQVGDVLEKTAAYTAYLAWYESDGAKVYGLLSVPTGERPEAGWPAVILLHGYVNPQTYQTNGSSYRAWWQSLAATGEWVVFKPDFRGHGNSEGLATGAYFGADYVVDTLTARAALSNWEEVDGARIGLWGHSMSGNTAMRALGARPEIPAVALWAGAVYTYDDFVRYGINDPSYAPDAHRDAARRGEMATPAAQLITRSDELDLTSPFWTAMIPTNFIGDGEKTGSIGIFHAQDDNVVNVGYSEDLSELLEEKGVPHQLHLYPTGGHNLTGATFNAAIEDLRVLLRENL